MTSYEEVGAEIGRFVDEKNKRYGSSFSKTGDILRILYSDTIKSDQYDDMLAVARIIDKLFRIATDKNAFDEDPWMDVVGYAILRYQQSKEKSR